MYTSYIMVAAISDATACERSFVIQDQTNFALLELSAHGDGIVRSGALDSITSRTGRIVVIGTGPASFKVVLSNGHTLTRMISDLCAATQIIIDGSDGDQLRLIIR